MYNAPRSLPCQAFPAVPECWRGQKTPILGVKAPRRPLLLKWVIFGAPRTEANQPGRGSFYQSTKDHLTLLIFHVRRQDYPPSSFFCFFLVLLNPYRDKFTSCLISYCRVRGFAINFLGSHICRDDERCLIGSNDLHRFWVISDVGHAVNIQ